MRGTKSRRHRPDRPGRHGPEPGPEHGRPRLHRGGVQPHRHPRWTSSSTGRPRASSIIGTHSLEELVGAAEAAAPGDADGQGRAAGGRVHRAAHAAPGAGRHHHRRRQLALPGHHPPDAGRSSPRACSTSARASPAARKARATGPSIMPGGSPGGLAARQADLPGHRRQGRPDGHARAATGSARTAPATTSRWSTTASSTATCR